MNFFDELSAKTISQHLFQKGPHKFWYLDIMINNVRIRGNTHTRDKRNAVQRAMELIRVRLTTPKPPAQDCMTLSEMRDRLLSTYLKGVSPLRANHASHAFLRLIGFLGDVCISEVTEEKADNFRIHLSTSTWKQKNGTYIHLTNRTINNNMEVLRACFSYAVKIGKWIPSNPFKNFKKMTVDINDPNPYLPETMRSIVEEAGRNAPDFGAAVEIYLYTGMRLKEGTTLTTADIDFEHKTLTLRAGTTKMRRKRIVPLNSRCVELLRRMCDRYGKPIPFSPGQIDEMFAKVRGKLEFSGRFHDIRKTTNTWLKFYAGLDDSVCEKILGHQKSNNVNSSIYTGFISDPIFVAMEKLAEVLYPSGPAQTLPGETNVDLDSTDEATPADGSEVVEEISELVGE